MPSADSTDAETLPAAPGAADEAGVRGSATTIGGAPKTTDGARVRIVSNAGIKGEESFSIADWTTI